MSKYYSYASMLAACGISVFTNAADKPNIIYILADDLGYNEVGCYGQQKIKTPHIDQIAAEGIKFTQHYSGQAVCAPSRCAFLTGLHMGHAYVRENKEVSTFTATEPAGATLRGEGQIPLPSGTVTISKILQENSYHTACIGKWGLGMHNTEGSPHNHGFDYYYGYLCQRHAHNYYPSHMWKTNYVTGEIEQEMLYEEGNGNDNISDHGEYYANDLMSTDALRYLDERNRPENKDKPFFLYLAYPVPHVSLQVPGSDGSQEVPDPDPFEYDFSYYNSLGWEDPPHSGSNVYGGYTSQYRPRAAYAAMISRMDRDIGRIMQKLKDHGIDDNTLVIFTSDNGATYTGGVDAEFFNSVGNLRGLKGGLFEGGIRIPMVARWPGKIVQNITSDHISAFWDMMPTFCDIIGVDTPEVTDGVSLLPTLLGESTQTPHDYLYWESVVGSGRQALRKGDWKAIRYDAKLNPDSTVQLYNLNSDLEESTDVATQFPEKAAELAQLMQEARVESEVDSFKFIKSYEIPTTQQGFETSASVIVTPVAEKYEIKSLDAAGMAVKQLDSPISEDTYLYFTVTKGSGIGYTSANAFLVMADKFNSTSMSSAGLYFGQKKLSISNGLSDSGITSKKTIIDSVSGELELEVFCDFTNRKFHVTLGADTLSKDMPVDLMQINYLGYSTDDAITTFSPIRRDEFGRVISCNGTSSYVEAVSFKGIDGNNPRSIEAWIKTTVAGKELVSWGKNSPGEKWVFYLNGSSGTLRVENNGASIVATTPVNDGEWHHVVCTFEGTNINETKFYVDGVVDSIASALSKTVLTNTAEGINLCISKGLQNRYWDGLIDEVRVWDVALTPAQVSALYYGEIYENNNEVLRSADSFRIDNLLWTNLKLYYNFNGMGSVVTDRSSNGNDGRMNVCERLDIDSFEKLGFFNTEISLSIFNHDGVSDLIWIVNDESNIDSYRIEEKKNGQWVEIETVYAENLGEYSITVSNPDENEIRIVAVKDGAEMAFIPLTIDRTVQITVTNGWNLIALPVQSDDFSPLLTKTNGPLWGWDSTRGCYHIITAPVEDQGFWCYSSNPEESMVNITGRQTEKPFPLIIGWNLAGPLNNPPPKRAIIFGWADGYSTPEELLDETKGYWYFLHE